MTPRIISAILRSPATFLFARVLLVVPFLGSGISKLVDFPGAVAEMAHFGLSPPAFYAVATIITQLVGSALILLNRAAWLGAGACAIFTALTIPIAHHFWTMQGEIAQLEFFFAVEHMAVIGGMILVAILGERTRSA
ncbi:DoxX family protein [Ancylobacter sp. Lp-2]|uniref:DoxX family protein n=1 Tax=Ancylobacter sp. Lp-2 TaxID=2881339 RepID=UPI001E3C7386|nr:DoxX family protein [Ancylobacter sp. Lp-2]MCB4768315.1 DoxX family protein [Ancylobacter sp. Lp-2]